jgi:pimeloyl-ACP methyl ester carboxylesterase
MRHASSSAVLLAAALLAAAPAASATAPHGTVTSADGVPIHYDSSGTGSPALVFVHCWACDRHLWDAVAPRFSKSYRVVTLDLAGHGESGRNRKEWTIGAYGEDVKAVVEGLGIKKAILIGHSMGALVALEAARHLQGRVVGLVFVDMLLDVEKTMSEEQTSKMVADLEKDFPGGVERFTRDYLFTEKSDPALVAQVVRQNAAAPPEIAIPSLAATWRYDPRATISEVRVPVHAINSDRYPTNVEANRRHFASFDVALMPGVGHYLMLEKPMDFIALLAQAVGSLDSASEKLVQPHRPRRHTKH